MLDRVTRDLALRTAFRGIGQGADVIEQSPLLGGVASGGVPGLRHRDADVAAKHQVFILSEQLAAHVRPVQRVELNERANDRLVLPRFVLAFLQDLPQRSTLERTQFGTATVAGIGIAEQLVEAFKHTRLFGTAGVLVAVTWRMLRQLTQQLRQQSHGRRHMIRVQQVLDAPSFEVVREGARFLPW